MVYIRMIDRFRLKERRSRGKLFKQGSLFEKRNIIVYMEAFTWIPSQKYSLENPLPLVEFQTNII